MRGIVRDDVDPFPIPGRQHGVASTAADLGGNNIGGGDAVRLRQSAEFVGSRGIKTDGGIAVNNEAQRAAVRAVTDVAARLARREGRGVVQPTEITRWR